MSITLKQAFDLFISDRETFCADKTLSYYAENLKQFISFVESNVGSTSNVILIDELPKNIFSLYVKYLRTKVKFDTHPTLSHTTGLLSNNSIRTYCRAIKAFFHYCCEEKFCDDYIRGVKLPRDDSKEVLPLFQHEVDTVDGLLNLNSEQGLRNYCIIHLMLDAGFRAGEVVNLTLDNVLFDKNVLVVQLSKNNKSRLITLCPKLKTKLFRYVTLYRNLSNMKESVFLQMKTREPINHNVIKQLFFRLKKRAAIERIHPHLLRHTFSTSYIMGGGNMEYLRLLLGHCDYSVTRNYLHLANQCMILHADIYKLDSVFFRTSY